MTRKKFKCVQIKMDTSSMWLCDLACQKHTGKSLPVPVLADIWRMTARLNRRARSQPRRPDVDVDGDGDVSIVPKGAKKGKWTKHIATKYRIGQAFRYR